jgi:hypothetical protein
LLTARLPARRVPARRVPARRVPARRVPARRIPASGVHVSRLAAGVFAILRRPLARFRHLTILAT